MSEQQSSESVAELHAACARDYGSAEERQGRAVAAAEQSARSHSAGNCSGGSWRGSR